MKQNFLFRWRLRRAIKKANKLHLKTGKLYHVVWLNNKLRVFTGKQLKEMRNQGKIRRDYNALMLAMTEFYNTSHRRDVACGVSTIRNS